ncbi:ead/Ea22-like family protein [Salmonella enterica]
MTALNKCALRQLAEKAGGEEWQSRKEPGIGSEYTVIVKGSLKKNQGWSTCRPVAEQVVNKKTMDFISAANPAVVLALLDGLEAAENRIAELEARAFNPAILDVIAERQRQQSVEGWTPEHDNAYQNSELADAAACYAIHAHNQGFSTPAHWPWSPDWWKQSGARRDLVKAGALILAEIERIDRAAGIGVKGE